jgi:hypothetical protein
MSNLQEQRRHWLLLGVLFVVFSHSPNTDPTLEQRTDYPINEKIASERASGIAVGTSITARPPAQIRTCGFPAYRSHLGCLTAKRLLGQG